MLLAAAAPLAAQNSNAILFVTQVAPAQSHHTVTSIDGSLLAPGQAGTNTDLQMRFLRPTTAGTLTATTHVVRKGRRTLVLECDVTDGAGRLVARASSTFLVMDAHEFAQG